MNRCAFASYHPAVMLAFFVGAIVLCVIVQQPLFQVVGMVAAACLYVGIRGRAAFKVIGGLAVAFVVIALINPLFTTMGVDVLFTYFGGRRYTLQGLVYGCSTSAMFVTIMLWFASYSHLMTSDRFSYLFGGVAPAFTLVLTMVLRLVPSYQRKAAQISTARKCIGKSAFDGGLRHRVEDGASILSSLTTWSLEGAIVTADSMRSRGYGLGKRTSFARYRPRPADFVLAAVLVVAFVGVCACVLSGVLEVMYLPQIDMKPLDGVGWLALLGFCIFLLAPTAINGGEALKWRCSLSRI